MASHIRKGDMVAVIAGKGRKTKQTGKVLRVLPDKDQVIVEGVNLHVKHLRKSQQHPQGGRTRKELPIHISNVLPLVDGKASRVRFESRDNGTKVRVAASNGEVIGQEIKSARD